MTAALAHGDLWLRRIAESSTIDALVYVWQQATRAGEWTDDLTEAAAVRKAVLLPHEEAAERTREAIRQGQQNEETRIRLHECIECATSYDSLIRIGQAALIASLWDARLTEHAALRKAELDDDGWPQPARIVTTAIHAQRSAL